MKIVLFIDMKIYLGDWFLWRIFTYNLYMKIILGFLSKVFTYNQGTKPAEPKSTVLSHPKKPSFVGHEKCLFFAPSSVIFSASDVQKTAKIRPPPRWVRRHNKNKYPRKGNMYSERFQKNKSFLGDFSKCKIYKSEFPRLFVI